MDRFEEVKTKWNEGYDLTTESEALKMCDDIEYLISEIETLRLDNTYLQQRLQRELEK